MNQPAKDKYLLGTVNNALKVMDLLSVRSELTLTEISRTLEIDKTAVFRLLYTLERREYVYKDDQGKYHLGLKFTNYGNLVAERQNIVELARPAMRSCCIEHSIPVHLGVLNAHGRVITMHKEEPAAGYFLTARIGSSMPAYCAAMGKVTLAEKPRAIRDEIIDKYEFKQYCPQTITDPEELKRHLDQVKAQGWAVDTNERIMGFGCIAAPVFNYSGACIAGVGLIATEALIERHFDEYLIWAKELAERISAAAGKQ